MRCAANVGIAELKGSAQRVIVDPPFLSEDCQTKGTCCYSFPALAELEGKVTNRYLQRP
jgi:hypothetical protein